MSPRTNSKLGSNPSPKRGAADFPPAHIYQKPAGTARTNPPEERFSRLEPASNARLGRFSVSAGYIERQSLFGVDKVQFPRFLWRNIGTGPQRVRYGNCGGSRKSIYYGSLSAVAVSPARVGDDSSEAAHPEDFPPLWASVSCRTASPPAMAARFRTPSPANGPSKCSGGKSAIFLTKGLFPRFRSDFRHPAYAERNRRRRFSAKRCSADGERPSGSRLFSPMSNVSGSVSRIAR